MTSGSNVITEWSWTPSESAIYTVQGSGNRLFSANFTYRKVEEGSQYNVSVTAVNSVSNSSTSLVVSVHHGINGISFNCSSKIIVEENATFIIQMAPDAFSPSGSLSAEIYYGDNSTSEILNLTTRLAEMKTSGVSLTKVYAIPGNFSILFRMYTELDELNFTCNIIVCELLISVLSFDKYAKRNEEIIFDFLNETTLNFNVSVNFGDGTVYENNSYILFDPYSIQPFSKIYNGLGEHNITTTICNSCFCVSRSKPINIFGMVIVNVFFMIERVY